MGTTTALNLDKKLLETIGDYKDITVTTAIAANTSLISTDLGQYRSTNDFFNGYWVFVNDYANAGVSRFVDDDDGVDTLLLRGGNLTTDGANIATFRLSKYSWANRLLSMNQAITEVFPNVHIPVDDTSIVAGSALPDGSFEDWSSSTALTYYSASNATLAKTSTVASVRGTKGSYSAKVTASAGNGYIYISSDDFPRLLDLAGCMVSFRAWAAPQTTNDATLVIYTIKADGTTQTLTSSTACPAGKFSLLELKDQTINDDLTKIEFRFKVTTNGQYCYFDSSRTIGGTVNSYVLPSRLEEGNISEVLYQDASSEEYPCDNINPADWSPVKWFDIDGDNGVQYLNTHLLPAECRIRLIGKKPLEQLSAYTDTISTSDVGLLRLLSLYSAYRLYNNSAEQASGSDIDKYRGLAGSFLSQYMRLSGHRMVSRPAMLNQPRY
jgi:hypothetical protein